MIHSVIKGDTTEKLFGAIEPFSASANEKMKIYLTKVFASVQMHLYSKYEVHSSSNKVLGAKKRFCAHLKSLLCAND